jgi:hypothetical protein
MGCSPLCWSVVATSSDLISRSDDGETGVILARRSRVRVDGQTVSGQYLGDTHPMRLTDGSIAIESSLGQKPTVDDEGGT